MTSLIFQVLLLILADLNTKLTSNVKTLSLIISMNTSLSKTKPKKWQKSTGFSPDIEYHILHNITCLK